MPYKTRRQKIAAGMRRYGLAKALDNGIYSYASEHKAVQKTQSAIETADDLGDLKRDILKITVISSIVILAQTCIRLTLF